MSISYAYRVGIGEEKALALVDRFESLLSIAMASPSELTQVPGIGNKLAKSLLGAIGRNLSEE
jgi:excinuclease UvrABC nuclease subunit